MALSKLPLFATHSKVRKITRYQEGKLENSSDLLEIHREGSFGKYAGRARLQYPKQNMSLVLSQEHRGAEVGRTFLGALKPASFPTQNDL